MSPRSVDSVKKSVLAAISIIRSHKCSSTNQFRKTDLGFAKSAFLQLRVSNVSCVSSGWSWMKQQTISGSEHKKLEAQQTHSKMVAINKYIAPTEETSTNAGTIMVRTGTPLNLNPAREEEIDLRQMDEQHVKSLQKEGE